MLELRDASRRVGGEAILDGVWLALSEEAPTAVAGLSPIARSGLARMLAGLDRPDKGAVLIAGVDAARARRRRGRIQLVAAGGAKPVSASVRRILESAGARGDALHDLAARCGLETAMTQTVRSLSLEMRVRLGLASACAGCPALTIFDAPLAGLDADSRDRLLVDLRSVVAASSTILVWLAERADDSVALDGRLVVMSGGVVIEEGPAADVIASPATLTAAEALAPGGLNLLQVEMEGARARLADGSALSIPAAFGLPSMGACTLAFHPVDAAMERTGENAQRFVVRVAPDGDEHGDKISVAFGGQAWRIARPAAPPPPGLLLSIFVAADRLMAFDAQGRAIRRAS